MRETRRVSECRGTSEDDILATFMAEFRAGRASDDVLLEAVSQMAELAESAEFRLLLAQQSLMFFDVFRFDLFAAELARFL